MKNKFILIPMLAVAVLGGGFLGTAFLANAATETTTTAEVHAGFKGRGPGGHGFRGGPGGGFMGTVSSISGTTLTLTTKDGGVVTVDAGSASVRKDGTDTTLGTLAVGDTVFIGGTLKTASVTALRIDMGMPRPPKDAAVPATTTQ